MSRQWSHRQELLWVGLGGALGALGRYGLLQWLGSIDDGYLPWGTLSANILGSLLLGLVAGLFDRGTVGQVTRLFFAVGMFGGFTTFSFFSYENLELMRDDQYVAVLVNIMVQVVAGVVLAGLGYLVGHRLR